jgi:hypothetical protein
VAGAAGGGVACSHGPDDARPSFASGDLPPSESGTDDGGDEGSSSGAPQGEGGDDDDALAPEAVQFYLARLAPKLVGRSLSYEENQQIAEDGKDAIVPIVTGWTAEPGFGEAIRYLVQQQLHASGAKDGVDYELPGNLAAEVAREDLPWSTILTADYCVDGSGNHIECDTGAPYEAGVLGTRAYMLANKGRFNLTRAKRMLETFACRVYPMENEIQIPLEKHELIPMFRAEVPEEQTVDEAKGGFGNGVGCYFCHSQFGAHAQLYVRYDDTGLWRANATGLQDPDNELGRAEDGLYASHMNAPDRARAEESQMFGEPVANLREAAEVITKSPLFLECTVKNLVAHTFGLQSGATDDVAEELVLALAGELGGVSDDPTIGQIVTTVFTDERVIEAAVAALEGQ